MGWLRDLMQHAQPPLRSYGALARAALGHPDWPSGSAPQPRSLASLLSKLDRNQELDWLVDRPEVQRVLERVLGAPSTAFRAAFDGSVGAVDAGAQRLRFEDAPLPRPLELLQELPPPGIPAAVLEPLRHSRLYWHAPVGCGKSLVGRWLEARGLASFCRARAAAELEGPLAGTGALFVEVADRRVLDRLLDCDRAGALCVAAPFALDPRAAGLVCGRRPAGGLTGASRWERVESPSASSYARELCGWLAARLPPGGRFDAPSAANWLESAAESGLAESLQTLLGLASLIDEIGVEELSRRRIDEHAARFVLRRFDEQGDHPSLRWLRRRAFDVLTELVRRTLTDSATPWDSPRSFDEWIRLVPVEHQRSIDAEWVRVMTSGALSAVAVKEVERALKQTPPGAFQVVRAFEVTGVLRHDEDGALVIAPRWLGRVTAERAARDLAEASPLEWGEALLRPPAARTVVSAVSERLERQPRLVDTVVELCDAESPASVAALALTFVTVGLRVGQSRQPGPDDIEALWDAQIELLVEPDGLPRPLIELEAEDGQPVAELGCFYLAALALSEQLAEHVGRRHALLRPWRLTAPNPDFGRVLDEVLKAVHRANESPWAHSAFDLAGRLREVLGPLCGPTRPPHPLEAPTVFASDPSSCSPELAVALIASPAALGAAQRLVDARGTPWPEAAGAIWRALSAASAAEIRMTPAHAQALWPHTPPEVLKQLLSDGRLESASVPYEQLSEAAWQAMIDDWNAETTVAAKAWLAMPAGALAAALENVFPNREAAHALWLDRAPEVRQALARHLELGKPPPASLLDTAPADETERLVELFEGRGPARSPQALEAVRRWLHTRVAHRGPGWRSAYGLLSRSLLSPVSFAVAARRAD